MAPARGTKRPDLIKRNKLRQGKSYEELYGGKKARDIKRNISKRLTKKIRRLLLEWRNNERRLRRFSDACITSSGIFDLDVNASGHRQDTVAYVERHGSATVTVIEIIRILSPKNTTYTIDSVPLTFTVIEPTSWIGYSLDGEANVTIVGNTTLIGLSDGPHLLRVYANDTYGHMGSDEVCFTVDTPARYIAVTNVTTSKTVVGRGYSMTINVTVENQGNVTEAFNVTAYANTTIIDTKEITLTSENSTIITFVWNTTGFAKYQNYTISAYAHPVPSETDIEDNSFIDGIITIVHPGDVDCDGKVSIKDVASIARAFGSSVGHPRYDPNYDINYDGIIKIIDIAIAARNFGYVGP